jgi:hypothetical protein
MPWGLASSGHTKTYMLDITKFDVAHQAPFEYNAKDIEWLRLCISPERLKPYYVKARGEDFVAFQLYIRNSRLSASLFEVIQALEVGLRNRVHVRMTERLGTEEWWDSLPLFKDELNDIAKAQNNISSRLAEVRPGRVVAELNFGFWVKLFAKSYEKKTWVPHLAYCFPAKLSRKVLHDRLTSLKELRNRIAHHETLLRRDPQKDYDDLLETIGWLSPTLRRWVEASTDFSSIYAARIPKEPKKSSCGLREEGPPAAPVD